MDLSDKNILVVGMGITGFAAAEVLNRHGASVRLSDAKTEDSLDDNSKAHIKELRDKGIECVLGKQTNDLLKDIDTVILSPVIPITIPLAQEALKRGILVSSEVELAYALYRGTMLAVTGTNGKTTTTALLGELLKTKFAKVGVGGNIGVALSAIVDSLTPDSAIAAEISSYQMEATNYFRPLIAAVLNISSDHLARHGSMANYQKMKEKIFIMQPNDGYLVLNYDDEIVREMKARAKAKVAYFSRLHDIEEGAFQRGDELIISWAGEEYFLIKTSELSLRGTHNIENVLAASLMAFLAGVEPAKMHEVIKSFQGVEHRLEMVRTIDNIPYYNDSKATNTESAIKALEAFDGGVVLIAGGDDKGTDLSKFMNCVKDKVIELILVGDAAKRFADEALVSGYEPWRIHSAGHDMEKAVKLARQQARQHDDSKLILLSPACASFDMYANFEERGRHFKEIVQQLV